MPVVRTRALLTLSVPLAAGGCLLGHAAGYALIGMSRRDAQLHGYLSFAPQFLAICVGLARRCTRTPDLGPPAGRGRRLAVRPPPAARVRGAGADRATRRRTAGARSPRARCVRRHGRAGPDRARRVLRRAGAPARRRCSGTRLPDAAPAGLRRNAAARLRVPGGSELLAVSLRPGGPRASAS